jgi:hypothetical protein
MVAHGPFSASREAIGPPVLVLNDNAGRRIGDSREDRRLDARVGKEACHSSRAHAIRSVADGCCHQVRAASVDPGRMDVRRSGDGRRVAQQTRRSADSEALL